ncbi:MAG: flavin-dependent oxidoreductase [Alphaproteobacteria bacterium]|nr:flavin-dependent oxidoreductase [Alphaproteobacteria bacterium]MCB9928704.1 flavin-dependent oxidoreductase [Alphaproteobacteria bacterium]
MHALIVGGGIGGLTTALSLHAAGISCRVYEAVPDLQPLGVGINVLPHAVRELTELGLADRLAATAIPTAELIYANRHGQQIWQEPRGTAAGYRWPQFSIHRGELQMALLAEARARLGADAILTDHRLTGFDQSGDTVTARFARADGATVTAEGDLLVACDGIHSTVRRHFYPDEGAPIWNGNVLWRATTLAQPYLTGRSMVMAGHQAQKFVCYPISRQAEERGEALINWIAEIKFTDRQTWRREDWNRRANLADFLPAFEDWDFGWLKVPDIIRGAAEVFEYPMVDRDPVAAWSFGRVTLLGDAAHPMYPIGSNGASQAILDARRLAWHLVRQPDPDAALRAYDAERRPATAAIVLANRENGPEQAMEMVHERAPDGFDDLAAIVSPAELAATAERYKALAGFDKDTLNTRESWSVRR